MRRYTIITIIRTIGVINHVYTAQRSGNDYTGNYICPTLNNDTKIVTDFICMPNTRIGSVRDETRGTNPIFIQGERTNEGTITSFVPKNGRMEVLLGTARTVTTPITGLTKRTAPVAAQPVRATATATVVPVQAATPLTTPAPAGRGNQNAGTDPFAALQTTIEALPDIRLETTYKRDMPTTVQQFLVNFFTQYNAAKNTIFTADKRVQTTTGRRRSLGDIYKLCKYYYPNVTLREVIVLLYTTLPTLITNGFRSSYCTTIRKRVWYFDRGASNTLTNTDTNDEYGHIANWYTSKI